MTDPQQSMPTPPPRSGRHPALSVLMFLIGVILLLPGLCATFFALGMGLRDGSLMGLWVICLLISAGGFLLLVRSFR